MEDSAPPAPPTLVQGGDVLAYDTIAKYSNFVEKSNFDSLAVVVDFVEFAKNKDWGTAWAQWSPDHAEIIKSYGGTNCVGLAVASLPFFGDAAGLMHSTKATTPGNPVHHIAIRLPFNNPYHPDDQGVFIFDPGLHLRSPIIVRKDCIAHYYERDRVCFVGSPEAFKKLADGESSLEAFKKLADGKSSPEAFKKLADGKWFKFKELAAGFTPYYENRPFFLNISQQHAKPLNKIPRVFYADSNFPNLNEVTKEALRLMKFAVYHHPPGKQVSYMTYDLRTNQIVFVKNEKTSFWVEDVSNMGDIDKAMINAAAILLHAPHLLDRILTVSAKKQQLAQLLGDSTYFPTIIIP